MVKKKGSVEEQFTERKTGRWHDTERPLRKGNGYVLGGNVTVRSVCSGSRGITLEIATCKHVELEGGEVSQSDSVPPSEANGMWVRTRLLLPESRHLRIGEHIFLEVHCSRSSTVTFRTRQMAAVTINPLPDSNSDAA